MKDLFGHDKVEEAIERLKMFEPLQGYYGATSFGKDSIVIMELCKEANIKVDWHYSMTTIDPPELIRYGRKYHHNVIWEKPEKPFLTMLVERGFHLRQHRWCCSEYKERGGSGRVVLTGIRWEESSKRKNRRIVEQCFKDTSKTYVNPIIDWTSEDVWEFIKLRNLPYCSLYDEGFKRLGCIMCPMSSNRVKEAERWPGYKKAFRRAFNRLYEKGKHRPSFKRWKSGDEMFEWWLRPNGDPYVNPDQTVMFE